MKTIQPLSHVSLKGRPSGLVNYQYVDQDGEPISAKFQTTFSTLRRKMLQIGASEALHDTLDSLEAEYRKHGEQKESNIWADVAACSGPTHHSL